jgi:ElaB/YqjD/DUF883 family membrane-anchored ribosome-binding protein
MEYSCSVCQYTSDKKDNVAKHINRKRDCGPGIKEIIEIPVEIKCNYCNKKFASSTSLKYHLKHTCKNRETILEEENNKLKERIKELEQRPTSATYNDNRTYIVVNNYEKTSLKGLKDKDYVKIIEDASEPYHIIPRFIKEVHFNPDMPENHNIYISNRTKNNKHLQVYRDNRWEIQDKDTEINNLINDKETNLSDWVLEKGEKYPEALEKFNEYLDQKYDQEIAKLVKDEVEQLLYNNRGIMTKNDRS